MLIRFEIEGQSRDGAWNYCFAWCRDAQGGIERARVEAPKFGHDYTAFRAVPIADVQMVST